MPRGRGMSARREQKRVRVDMMQYDARVACCGACALLLAMCVRARAQVRACLPSMPQSPERTLQSRCGHPRQQLRPVPTSRAAEVRHASLARRQPAALHARAPDAVASRGAAVHLRSPRSPPLPSRPRPRVQPCLCVATSGQSRRPSPRSHLRPPARPCVGGGYTAGPSSGQGFWERARVSAEALTAGLWAP